MPKVAACVAEPRCIAVTFWGITDKYSWLNSYSPLGCSGRTKPLGCLWDDNFKKKPAYTGVLDAYLGLQTQYPFDSPGRPKFF